MIDPKDVKEAAKKAEEDNYNFRLFLKEHADSKILDEQFHKLHKELFNQINCKDCLNCCRKLTPTFHVKELDQIAKEAGMETEELLALCDRTDYEEYQLREDIEVCPFLTESGCEVEVCKPATCRDFPYTSQDNRLESLLGMLSFVRVCPVVYEIFEELKKEYHYH